MKNRLLLCSWAAALLLCSAAASPAQILYLQQVAPAPGHIPPGQFQLRQINGDGSGDITIGLPFADVRSPVWSRDAAIFAISAPDPNRPTDRSYNVYAINAATGAIQQVTFFTAPPPDTNSQFVVAGSKAFSPDRNAMALTSTIVSQGQGQTQQTTVQLQVFSTATVNPLLVHVHTATNGYTVHGGEGVDWSPAQNVLVTPLESTAPNQGGASGTQQTTALFFLEPVDGAVQQGRYQQITFPRGDMASDFSFVWSEHDYQPRFSPNGAAIAYVRSFQNRRFDQIGPDPDFQSLRILNLQTGAGTEVANFPQGRYVSGLDWSPDGAALVFDLALQGRDGNGQLYQGAAGETAEIYIVNVNGTGLRRLRGASAVLPAWKPLPSGQQTPIGSNVTVQSPSGDASVTFPAVSQAGGTTFTPVNPASAGTPPQGFTLLNNAPAFDITTSAVFTPPVTVCYSVPAITSEEEFARVRILHAENGQLIDRTILAPGSPAPNFGTHTVCGRVDSLSPVVTALAPSSTSPSPSPTPPNPTPTPPSARQLLNVATRMRVQTGDNVLIGGFIITGTESKNMIIRGIGPSLAPFLNGALANPTLELFQGSTLLASNDDWRATQEAEIRATGIAPTHNLESAIVRTLAPGSYTAVLRGRDNTGGIGIVEGYDLNATGTSKLANIATRGFVEGGDDVMIGGFILGGNGGGDARAVVRAIGPSLGAFGVPGTLQDPTLELKDANGSTLLSNDDWPQSQQAEVNATGLAPTDSRESALVISLPSGSYTAIVRGKNGATGVAIVEVYNL